MRKKKNKIIIGILSIALLLNISSPTIFAISNLYNEELLTTEQSFYKEYVEDENIDINFEKNNEENNTYIYDEETPVYSTRTVAAFPLAAYAGTYVISGLGKVLVTEVGKVIIAGTVIAAGTYKWNKVVSYLKNRKPTRKPTSKYEWDKSAEKATYNCNKNKQHHILHKKHNWNKFNKKPNWGNVAPLIIKTLKNGSERHERASIYIRTLTQNGKTISVRFIKNSKKLVEAISTAWVK